MLKLKVNNLIIKPKKVFITIVFAVLELTNSASDKLKHSKDDGYKSAFLCVFSFIHNF